MASVCSCRNSCSRTERRGACPCRQAGRQCGELCTCGTKRVACSNRSCELMETHEECFADPTCSPPSPFTPPQEKTRKRKKTNPGTPAKRRLIMDAPPSESMEWEATQQHTAQVTDFVNQQDFESLRKMTTELFLRAPAVFADYSAGFQPAPQPPGSPGASPGESPDWCKCGNCRDMPTQRENKCCHKDQKGAIRGHCATSTDLFKGSVLNPTFVNAMMAGYFDLLAHEEEANNASYRFHAYRSYVFLTHGPLGSRNRRVVPSCCVLAIQHRYPDPNGQYTGFKPTDRQVFR